MIQIIILIENVTQEMEINNGSMTHIKGLAD